MQGDPAVGIARLFGGYAMGQCDGGLANYMWPASAGGKWIARVGG